MAEYVSPITNVTTESNGADPELPVQPAVVPGALELSQSWLMPGVFQSGGLNMLEIVIVKSRGGRDLKSQFSNTYLFNGVPDYVSAAAITLLTNLTAVEGSIFFENTFFLRAVLRQLEADGSHIDGHTRSVPLVGNGSVVMPAGSEDVPGNIVLAMSKSVLIGRAGLQEYRFAVTSDEFNTYVETGVPPPRIAVSDPNANPPTQSLAVKLANISGDTGLAMILPPNPRYAAGAPRPVTTFRFEGIRFRQETFDKVSSDTAVESAAQRIVNENGRKIAKLLRDDDALPQVGNEGLHTGIMALIAELVASARSYVENLPIRLQAQITWPPIYADIRVIFGG